MKRSLTLLLTAAALAGGLGDAARRSGGGFGGSRSSGYSAPRSTPRYTPPPRTVPRYTPPANTSGRTYTAPRSAPATRTPATTQRSTAGSGTAARNRAPTPAVSASQLSAWKNVRLPAGVPRSALTYSPARSAQYPYQLSPGRYYPYPPTYYRRHGIGADLLKYALIFTAVSSVADALDGPDVIVNTSGVPGNVVVPAQQGPNLWTYLGVGSLAAAAGWFLLGRRR